MIDEKIIDKNKKVNRKIMLLIISPGRSGILLWRGSPQEIQRITGEIVKENRSWCSKKNRQLGNYRFNIETIISFISVILMIALRIHLLDLRLKFCRNILLLSLYRCWHRPHRLRCTTR